MIVKLIYIMKFQILECKVNHRKFQYTIVLVSHWPKKAERELSLTNENLGIDIVHTI